VYSEIVPPTISPDEIAARKPRGIIFSGGPASVHVEGAPSIDPGVYELGIPVLGICYGAQLIAQQRGGTVGRTDRGEYGRTIMSVTGDGGYLLGGLPTEQPVWMSHFDAIVEPPTGVATTASTPDAPVAAFEDATQGLYGVQFHPEVIHTPHGQHVIERFLRDACATEPSWTMASIIDTAVEQIRAQVGDGRAICGLSGGVDSAVAAALVHKAIGHRLTCVFVDTGLMRLNEGDQVVETFHRHLGMELIHVRAAERFFDALAGVTEPEDKRKTIGELFIRIFEDAKGGIEDARFLVQGTLYPDVIESGSEHAATIKSHHNVGGLPDDIDFDLVEPLRSLFKDEVRKVGSELGLPDEIVWRQPFPGPGLGVRIIGEVTPDKVETLQHADAIVREELKAAGLEREIWQSFAVLPDIRSVGVMGDERTYGWPIIIRAVTSEDAMTADWARIPYDVLETMSSRVINEVPGVNRVAYDITSKPPGTIEWE
jgi:GMP synthase (glutamine-hydrolysing)